MDLYKKIVKLTILLGCFSYSFACSQTKTKGITPMHEFFKQYADSTIIMEYPTDSYDSPEYRIITKSKDTINCFIYVPRDSGINKVISVKPKVLGAFLLLKKNAYTHQLADINVFFSLVNLHADTTQFLWKTIQKLGIWRLNDDSNYGSGCPKDKPRSVVMDGAHHIVHLITKKEIKTLSYYAPAFYEDQCPGNKNRQAIIQFEEILAKKIPL